MTHDHDLAQLAFAQAWQLAALIGVVAAAVRLVARNRPHLAHALWLVVLIKCLTPPIWSSPAGAFCWLQTRSPGGMVNEDSRGSAGGSGLLYGGSGSAPVDLLSEDLQVATANDVLPEAESRRRFDPLRSQHNRTAAWMSWLVAVWLAGAAASLTISLLRWVIFLRKIRRSPACDCPDLKVYTKKLARSLGVRRRVRLLVTASGVGPAVVGLWRPTIVLPEIVVRDKSNEELAPILAHELIHIRRGDLWMSLAQLLARSLWWPHPLVWLAMRWAAREAERCCDEEVLGGLRCHPARYARCLLDVLEQKSSLAPAPSFPGVRPVEITSQRLERIMKLGQGCRRRAPWWCWVVAAMAAMVSLPGAALVAAGEGGDGAGVVVIEATIVSGSPSAVEALHREWTVLPAEIPGEESIDDARPAGAKDADVDAHAKGSVSQTVERRTPAMYAVLDPARAAALLDKAQKRRRLQVEAAPKVAVFSGDESSVLCNTQRPFVVGVKQGENGKSEPQIRVVSEGWAMRLRPVSQDSRVRLGCKLTLSDIRQVENMTIPRGGNQKPLTIQVPEVVTTRIALGCDVPLGHALVIGGLKKTGSNGRPKATLVVLRCSEQQKDTNVAPRSLSHSAIESRHGAKSSDLKPWRLDDDVQYFAPGPHSRPAAKKTDAKQTGRLMFGAGVDSDAGVAGVVYLDPETPEKAAEQDEPKVTISYRVTDLVVPMPSSVSVPPQPPKDDREKSAALADFDSLIDLIKSTVAPESWGDTERDGEIQAFPSNLLLVCRQTPEVHQEIAELLTRLRRQQDVQVILELRLMRFAGDRFWERLGVDIDPQSRDGHLGTLTQKQARQLVDALQGDARSSILQAPKVTLFNGQGASMTLISKNGDKPGLEVKLAPVASADRRSVRLRLAVNAKDAMEALSGAQEHRIPVGHGLLLDVTGTLPPAPPRTELGTPILSKLPYMSRLFRNTPRKADAERALLLVTPRVIVLEEEKVNYEAVPDGK